MARTAKTGKKNSTQEKNPKLVYEKLELSKRIACYHFWCYLNSDGQEGWNPLQVPGSKWNWRSSNYLQANIKENSWSRVGKAMASLALDLQQRGIRLVDPHKKKNEDIVRLRLEEQDSGTKATRSSETEASDTESEYSAGRQQFEEESIPEEPSTTMPPSILKKKAAFAGIDIDQHLIYI